MPLGTESSLQPLLLILQSMQTCRLQLLMKYLFLFITLGTVSAASHDAPARRTVPRCPREPFTLNITVARKEEAHQLKVLVPNITSLRQFVNCSDPLHVRGFSIAVFEMAFSILTPSRNMSINYTCFNFSSTSTTYKTMVESVANGSFDAVVGDVTIGAERLSIVDFTQKYMESGMVILTKVAPEQVSAWLLFGRPFSWRMWSTIVGAFVLTGLLVCYLERNDHPEFTQDHITHRISHVLWFTAETLVLLQRESLKSGVARGVLVAWLFFVVLLSASYTAGLSSLLTATNLSPTRPNLVSLKDSGQSIGYRKGSIAKDYLTLRFNVPEQRLVPMRMISDFTGNLTGGVVAVIVDELPYTNITLSALSSFSCDFGIVGPPLTQEGFGFGFNKKLRDIDLEGAFSRAILNLTESGCLQDLQAILGGGANKCSESKFPSSKVTWKSSLIIFIPLLGSVSICMAVHYVKRYLNLSNRYYTQPNEGPSRDDMIVTNSSITQRRQHEQIELQQYP